MRSLLRLHRLLALLLVAQVIIWLVTGFYFSWLGHTDLAGEKYIGAPTQHPIQQPPSIGVPTLAANYPKALAITLRRIGDTPQYSIQLPNSQIFVDANSGALWTTSQQVARAVANSSYIGPGRIVGEQEVNLAHMLPQQAGAGYAFTFDDSEQTVIYVDKRSATIAGYGNRYSTLTDWMFRLHFMDYSGQRDFNNLWNRSLGLVFLFFCTSGLLIIARQLVSRRQQKKRAKKLTHQEA
ncbi:MAG TPA: hypothetical protein VFM61_03070 [Pseudidiomarina sp.]|nr:hypothetical protein [Pseudidiomarina sp.]